MNLNILLWIGLAALLLFPNLLSGGNLGNIDLATILHWLPWVGTGLLAATCFLPAFRERFFAVVDSIRNRVWTPPVDTSGIDAKIAALDAKISELLKKG